MATHWKYVLSASVLLGLAATVYAFLLAFLPLPTQSFLSGSAWCGPGSSSESAVFVRINPDSVNGGSQPFITGSLSASQQQQLDEANTAFKAYCTGVADTRLEQAAVVLLLGLAVGGAAVLLLKQKPRWLQDV